MGWFDFTTGVTPNVQIDGTLTVGSDGVGHDVTFYGDTSGAYLLWDADTDKLILTGGSQIYINSQTLQALRAEYNITTQQGAYVHGVKVELTRGADIQPSTGCWFGGQFVLNIGTGYADLDKPAYAVQGIIKGDAASPDGVDIHAGRFETQSAGKVSDIVHILANTGTTVVGSLEYIAAHVAPGVAMLNINAQSSITVPTSIKIMSGAGSSYNYGLDLTSATINTADIKLHHGHTIIDSATTLTLDTALAMGANKVTGVTDPTAAQDAATKNYADNSAGGLYGINVETLTDNKTLTPGTDEIYQYLDPGGANRIITLDTASATAGDRFVIRNMDAWNHAHYLEAKQAAVSMDTIYANDVKEFIFNGTNWEGLGQGTRGVDTTVARNLGIGHGAIGWNYGTAIGVGADAENRGASLGYIADATTEGTAIGFSTFAMTYGVAVGHEARGDYYGVAVGWHTDTNAKQYSIALGLLSETERSSETSINIDGESDQENNVVQGRWTQATANDTPVELWCGGLNGQRFTIRASSALAFTMKVVARDNVAGEVAMWTVADGLIKRDAAGNTTMVACTVVEVADESTDWAVAVTADDTNEALIITVTGDGTNPTQFAAVMDGVETHF